MKGFVTINTDASYHSEYCLGAYAFWIKSDFGRITMSGALKNPISNKGRKGSSEAEVQCIINAFHVLKNTKWPGIKKIIVNTDSLNAISIFENKKADIKKWGLSWGDPFRGKFNKLKPLDCTIEFRHIPSHKNTDTAKAWINEWCDKKAKEMLWAEINKTK